MQEFSNKTKYLFIFFPLCIAQAKFSWMETKGKNYQNSQYDNCPCWLNGDEKNTDCNNDYTFSQYGEQWRKNIINQLQ